MTRLGLIVAIIISSSVVLMAADLSGIRTVVGIKLGVDGDPNNASIAFTHDDKLFPEGRKQTILVKQESGEAGGRMFRRVTEERTDQSGKVEVLFSIEVGVVEGSIRDIEVQNTHKMLLEVSAFTTIEEDGKKIAWPYVILPGKHRMTVVSTKIATQPSTRPK